MNLITNAVEAVVAGVGLVTLTTGVTECDALCIQKSRLDKINSRSIYFYRGCR